MEKDRINDTEKSFLSGKKRMDKLKVLMKYAGISVFEYFPDSDRMVLYNEQLEEEKGIMPFLGQLTKWRDDDYDTDRATHSEQPKHCFPSGGCDHGGNGRGTSPGL